MKRSFILIAALMIATLTLNTANALPRALCNRIDNLTLRLACILALFDDEATLSAAGRTITASGIIPPCGANEKTVRISATLKQDTIQTAAQGEAEVACTAGKRTRFTVQTRVPPGKPAFMVEAPVEACAVAFTRGATGQIVDIKHWCSFPTLVTE